MNMATPAGSDQLSSSSVSFPVSESPSRAPLQPAPFSRPFRRISLPTLPHKPHRDSVVSVSSFDSLPEDEESQSGMAFSTTHPVNARFTRPIPTSPIRSRPMSVESPRRRRARHNSGFKPAADAKAQQRKQIIAEFYTTEKTYVDGLELIYSNFLTPIVASLESPKPILDRTSLTNVFSNFVDIWNFHRSFFSALTDYLGQDPASTPPPLSSLLLSHFPYLSLYNPFITSFPSMVSTLTDMVTPPSTHRPSPRYNQVFANFISIQESDPRCGRLKLRDWLLTIVQRCPRYLLLLKDLVKHTDEESSEYTRLNSVLVLVTKITSTLDTSLRNHAQILSLLALQRSTAGLPFHFIEPGRTLLKRSSLLQIERSSAPLEREFLLFSDCLVWLASEEIEHAWNLGWSTSTTADSGGSNPQTPRKPQLVRHKSKSNAELSKLGSDDTPSTAPQRYSVVFPSPTKKPTRPPPPVPRRLASTGDEKWIFKGKSSLVDVDVIIAPPREAGDERKFEVLSPEGSFSIYAGSEDDREDWVSEIRQAKAQLLASLNVINPNSTLTSSASTNHVRRSLQALPFPPSDGRIATVRAVRGTKDDMELTKSEGNKETLKGKNKEETEVIERRRKVEHWVPAIWIPDDKTDSCMRCGRSFNWRRRRHHCRLCGRCVCAPCSGRTFFIADTNPKEASSKPARACDVCYEMAFPIVESSTETGPSKNPTSSFANASQAGNDTITSLSKLPLWVSVSALPTEGSQAQALMVDPDLSLDLDSPQDFGLGGSEEREIEGSRHGRVRLKSFSRPKSYHQILEDFQLGGQSHPPGSPLAVLMDSTIEESSESNGEGGDTSFGPSSFQDQISRPLSASPRKRQDDTVRRSKRFSVPAIALHTTNVTARIVSTTSGSGSTSRNAGPSGSSDRGSANRTSRNEGGVVGRLRRFSLGTGGRTSRNENGAGGLIDEGAAAHKLAETLAKVGK